MFILNPKQIEQLKNDDLFADPAKVPVVASAELKDGSVNLSMDERTAFWLLEELQQDRLEYQSDKIIRSKLLEVLGQVFEDED